MWITAYWSWLRMLLGPAPVVDKSDKWHSSHLPAIVKLVANLGTNLPPHLPPPYSSPLPSLLKLLFTRQILFTEAAKLQLIVHDKSLNHTINRIIKENHMRSPCLNLTTRFAAWGNGWPDEGRSIRGLFTERGGRFMSSLFFCLIISCWGSQLDRATSA